MLLNRLQPFWDFMASPPFVPQAYWDAVSNEQRIKYLFARLYRLCEYANELSKNQDELTTAIEQMRAELDAKLKELDEKFAALEDALTKNLEEELLALEQRLKNLINDLAVAQGWDVESGQATSAKDEARILRSELYNSSTVDELKKNFKTVRELKITFIPGEMADDGVHYMLIPPRVDMLSTRANSVINIWNWWKKNNADFNNQPTPKQTFEAAAQLSDFYTFSLEHPYKYEYTWANRHDK